MTPDLKDDLHTVAELKPIYPAQCSCGHLFLEKYELKQPTDDGVVGFCWCGFCRSRLNVRATARMIRETQND